MYGAKVILEDVADAAEVSQVHRRRVDAIIAGAYSGTVSRAKTLLAPQLLGHWADAPVYPYDPAKAKALLAEAGVSDLKCTLTCLTDARAQAEAQIIQANLAEAGVTAVIQPGGSIRDDEVIAAADERGLAMVFTGMRHFRH